MQRLNKQTGATLIEILVSILVISFGILAMAAVQSNSVRFHKTTEYRATATLLAADLADRMRANNAGTSANEYQWLSTTYAPLTIDSVTPKPDCGTEVTSEGALNLPCAPNDMADKDLAEWQQRLLLSLPGASGSIGTYNATTRALDLWIAWQDPNDTDSSGASNSVASTECPAAWAGSTRPHQCLFMRVAL